MLSELEKRRPDYRGGVPVKLADGQLWAFARPEVVFVPADNEDGFDEDWNLGPDYRALIVAAQNASDGGGIIKAELALARYLLCLNYDLTTEDLRGLLRFSYGAGANAETLATMKAIREVIFGNSEVPKTSAVG